MMTYEVPLIFDSFILVYVSIESFFVLFHLLVYFMLRCLSIDKLFLLVTYNKMNCLYTCTYINMY